MSNMSGTRISGVAGFGLGFLLFFSPPGTPIFLNLRLFLQSIMAESQTLVIKKLPLAIDDQALHNAFDAYGHIVFCKIAVDKLGV